MKLDVGYVIERAEKVLKEMGDVIREKTALYGTECWEEFGITFAFFDIARKYYRVKKLLIHNEKIDFETAREELIDLANFCVLAVVLLERLKEEGGV